jgi:hypothetical protein
MDAENADYLRFATRIQNENRLLKIGTAGTEKMDDEEPALPSEYVVMYAECFR